MFMIFILCLGSVLFILASLSILGQLIDELLELSPTALGILLVLILILVSLMYHYNINPINLYI